MRKHLVFTEKSLSTLAAFLIVTVVGFLWFTRRLLAKRARRFVRDLTQPSELKQHLASDDTVTDGPEMDSSSSSDDSEFFHQKIDEYMDDMSTSSAKEKASEVLGVAETKVNNQQDCIKSLKVALDMERVQRILERDRLQTEVEALRAQLSDRKGNKS